MAKRDYYEVLGVPRGADEAEIKKAYRRIAMKHHPDRNPGDKAAEESFKEANEAYSVLSDPQKKAAYDQFGHAGVDGQGGAGGFGGGGASFSDIFGDVFGDIFGGGGGRGGRTGPQRGADLRYNLEIDLEDAVHGATIKIRVPTLETCEECHGSGARRGSSPVSCTTCGGAGQIRMQQGFFSVQQTCPNCRGKGKMIKDPCGSCHGRGRIEKQKTLSVKIPAGRRYRRPHPPVGRGRGRPRGRAARRSLRAGRGARAPDLRARRQEPVLRGADQLRRCRARRRAGSAHAGRACEAARATRDADRQDVPPARQGREARCAAARSVT